MRRTPHRQVLPTIIKPMDINPQELWNKALLNPEFNEAGAYLHDKYFTQFHAPTSSNVPTGNSLNFIEEHYESFSKFKEDQTQQNTICQIEFITKK